MCVCVYTYINTYKYVHTYIHKSRETGSASSPDLCMVKSHCSTLASHEHSAHELRAEGDLRVLQRAALCPALFTSSLITQSPYPHSLFKYLCPTGFVFSNLSLAFIK